MRFDGPCCGGSCVDCTPPIGEDVPEEEGVGDGDEVGTGGGGGK